MSVFTPNFLILDFPGTLSPGKDLKDPKDPISIEYDFENGNQENFLAHFNHFISLLQIEFSQQGTCNLVGLPNGKFYQSLSHQISGSTDIATTSFTISDINKQLRELGFREGIHKLIGSLSASHSFSIIFGLNQNSDKMVCPADQFYSRLAQDLHSQPIWFIPKSWLGGDGDSLYSLFSYLLESYFFIDDFPCIVYDSNGLISSFTLPRSLVEKKDNLKAYLNNPKDLQAISDWTKLWGRDQLEKLLPSSTFDHSSKKISPVTFKQKLIENAKKSKKKILLVEGDDPRVLEAVDKALYLGIEKLAVMGNQDKVQQVIDDLGLDLKDRVEIIEPHLYHQEYAPVLYETMKRKNITQQQAEEWVKNDLNLAGVMLQKGVIDGVVAGAHYSTADTLKAAIRMVGLNPKYSFISSFFIMLLPQNVMVFADCAVNPSPDAEQLAEITRQTVESAQKFISSPLRVSLISFSTMGSAQTPEVEKVNQAVQIMETKVKELKIENVIIEGPVQYDAAIDPEVARKKFPESRIGGKSNVLIFPNLETGNTVYKAVQQSYRGRGCYCLGPVIQGLKKPYNDLSRGASVDDILQTILVTAVQDSIPN